MSISKYHVSKNLFDKSSQTIGCFVRAGNITPEKPLGNIENAAGYNLSAYIAVQPNTIYTIKYPVASIVGGAGIVYYSDNSGTTISGVPLGDQGQTYTFTTPNNCTYIRFSYDNTEGTDVMLNKGSTSLPYEPYGNSFKDWFYRKYETATDTITTLPKQIIADGQSASAVIKGNLSQSSTPTPASPIYPTECGDLVASGEHSGQYQIPISSGGTTTNVYLGEVQSERQIKKLVLTGEETGWNVDSTNLWHLNINNVPATSIEGSPSLYCTHYDGVESKNTYSGLTDGKACIRSSGNYIWIRDSQFANLNEFKTWLAQQYDNGTPVTVWYVLATPQTTTLNEPIRKIGNYADSVSVTGIPTTGTAEQFDIDTDMKPSEVDLTYHGWHEHNDTKF